MPRPYITAAEIIQQAHELDIHPYEQLLDIADGYGWEDEHTVEALHAVRRTMENLPQPQPRTHHAIQLADEFHRELDRHELDLRDSVASFLSTLASYEQTGDPDEELALERLEQHLAQLVGLAHDDQPDDDTDQPN